MGRGSHEPARFFAVRRADSIRTLCMGGVIPDVQVQWRRKVKFPGVSRHVARATSVLLLLLLTSGALVAAEPTATPAVSSAGQPAPVPPGNSTLYPWVTPAGNPVYWDTADLKASLYDQMILAFCCPTDHPIYDCANTSWGGPALSASHFQTFEEEEFGLSPPANLSPSGLLTSGSDLTLSWDAVTGADGYNVSVDDWYSQTNVLSTSVTDNSVPLPTLADNQGYIASVMAYSSTLGTSDWSWVHIDVCSYNAAPTGTPVFSAPAANGFVGPPHNGNDVTFTWSRVATAARYWLVVLDWQDNTWPTAYSETVLDPGGSGTDVSSSQVHLTEAHVYCANVLSSNPAGQGPYSAPLYFGVSTASGPPPATSFTAPQQTLSYSSIPYYTPKVDTTGTVFEWPKTAKTIGYNFMLVEVDPDYNFLGQWWINDDGTSNPAEFTLPEEITLKDGCKYEMWVDGYNAWGLGDWTVDYFSPGDPPPTTAVMCTTATTNPVGTTPQGTNDLYDKRPTLSCPSVARATQYFWHIDEQAPSGSWSQKEVIETVAGTGSTQSYTLSWAEALTPGLVYAVRVRAHNLLGDTDQSDDAVYWQVTPVPAQTFWVQPVGHTQTQIGNLTQVTFAWANQEHVLTWNLSVYDDWTGQFVYPNGPIATTLQTIGGVERVTCQLHLQEHCYTAAVYGSNNSGDAPAAINDGTSHEGFSVSILPGGPAAPVLSSPIGSTAETTPTFEWSSVSGAGYYYVVLYEVGNPTAMVTQGLIVSDGEPSQPQLSFPTGSGTGSYTVPLTQGLTYQWQVAAVNGYGWGSAAYSEWRTFVVGPPAAPAITSPTQGSTTSNAPSFNWGPVLGADYY